MVSEKFRNSVKHSLPSISKWIENIPLMLKSTWIFWWSMLFNWSPIYIFEGRQSVSLGSSHINKAPKLETMLAIHSFFNVSTSEYMKGRAGMWIDRRSRKVKLVLKFPMVCSFCQRENKTFSLCSSLISLITSKNGNIHGENPVVE